MSYYRPTNYSLLILFIFSLNNSFAQQKKEIKYSGFFDSYYYPGPYNYTLGAGIAMYRGDICSGIGCNNISPSFNVGANYRILPRIYVGGNLQYISLGAIDQIKERNLSFKSTLLELTPYGRYYFIDDIVRTARDRSAKPKIVKPFFSLGLSFIYILSAKSRYQADTGSVPLANTGGSKIAFGIPAGIGAAFWITHYLSIVPELTYTYTFSDNLDNVINWGKGTDGYAMFNVKLQFTPNPHIKKKKKSSGGTNSNSGGGGGNTGAGNNGGGENSGVSDTSATPKKELKKTEENKAEEKIEENKTPTEQPLNTEPTEINAEPKPEEQPAEKEKEEIK